MSGVSEQACIRGKGSALGAGSMLAGAFFSAEGVLFWYGHRNDFMFHLITSTPTDPP